MKGKILAFFAPFFVVAAMLMAAIGTSAQDYSWSVEIHTSTVVRGPEGSEHKIGSWDTPEHLVRFTCSASVLGSNQGSKHPNSDLVVKTGNSVISLPDVEEYPGKETPASGQVTMGDKVEIFLTIGKDKVFSGGISITFTCQPPATETPEPSNTPTATATATTTATSTATATATATETATATATPPSTGTQTPTSNPQVEESPTATPTALPRAGMAAQQYVAGQYDGHILFMGEIIPFRRVESLSEDFGSQEALVRDNVFQVHLDDAWGEAFGALLARAPIGTPLSIVEGDKTTNFISTNNMFVEKDKFEETVLNNSVNLLGLTCSGNYNTEQGYSRYLATIFQEVDS
jgi:hypothetical protein